MKVLALSDYVLPEGHGGVERTLDEIYPRIVARTGWSIVLLALSDSKHLNAEQRRGYRILRARRLSLERVLGIQACLSVDVWPDAMNIVRRWQPDILHAHTLFFQTSIVAAVLAHQYRIPLFLTLHLGDTHALPQPYRTCVSLYEKSLGRFVLATAQRVVCVSNDVAAYARKLGVPRQRLTVIPNGVDLSRFSSIPRQRKPNTIPVVLYVGRLILNKGPQLLIEAAASLRDAGIAFCLRLAGEGPLRPQLEQQVRELGLTKHVTFLGHVARIEAELVRADIFVRPSLTEGMSLAVLEALAAGLPCVLTAVSGTRQLVQAGYEALVIPPGSVPQLTLALRTLLTDETLRAQLGAAARRRAQDFTWDRAAERTLQEMYNVGR